MINLPNGQIIERVTGRTYDGSLKNGIGTSSQSVWPFCRTLLENQLSLASFYYLFNLFMYIPQRKCLYYQLSKKMWQEPTVMQNWDVWSKSPAQTMPSKIKSNHTTVQQIRFYIYSPLFSIHFTFGPFLAFIRLWIECIILRPCIGNHWQVTRLLLTILKTALIPFLYFTIVQF